MFRYIDRTFIQPLRDEYPRALEAAVGDCKTLLDVGCGANSPIRSFAWRLDRAVGVDGFEPSLERARALGAHHELHRIDLLDIAARFPARSFECVLASDVVEHFEKADGHRLLDAMERIASRRVVVFTPNGFLPQGEYDGNPRQVHRSGWTTSEMDALGYRITGINGWKPLRTEYANLRFRPTRLHERLSLLTQPLVTHRPRFAFQLLCVKDLG